MTTPLKDATQRVIAAIEAFSRECEALNYTDTNAAWALLNSAQSSLAAAMQTEGSPFITAFLLDPSAATIETVLLNKEDMLSEFYRLIGCRSIDSVWLDDRHVVYFDDEGMLGLVTGLFTISDHDAAPIAGRAIITCDDGEGGDIAPILTIGAVAEKFRIFRPAIAPDLVSLEPVSPGELGGAVVHATRLGGLRLALDRPALTIKIAGSP